MKKALESVEKEVKENRIVMETVCGTFRGIRTGKIPKTNDEGTNLYKNFEKGNN